MAKARSTKRCVASSSANKASACVHALHMASKICKTGCAGIREATNHNREKATSECAASLGRRWILCDGCLGGMRRMLGILDRRQRRLLQLRAWPEATPVPLLACVFFSSLGFKGRWQPGYAVGGQGTGIGTGEAEQSERFDRVQKSCVPYPPSTSTLESFVLLPARA